MPVERNTVRALHDGVVFCQVSGCGSVAAYLLCAGQQEHSPRVEAYCEAHAAQFRAAGSSPRRSRKPNGVEMGRARTFSAKA